MGANTTAFERVPPRVLPEVYTFEDGRNVLYVHGANIVTEDLGEGFTGIYQVSDELIEEARAMERGEGNRCTTFADFVAECVAE